MNIRSILQIFVALAILALPAAVAVEVPSDVAGMKVNDLRAGGDQMKRYFTIHGSAQPPQTGWRTLFVLPGGPGDAEFRPFITNIAKNALSENYLVVQLVARVWNPEQAQHMVWPMEKKGVKGIKFTTPEFFLAVRDEVAKAHRLDPRYSFTLTWSSSGTNGYALSMLPKTGVTGTFVAMSVFQPDNLPRLSAAKGRPYYLYHSPTDFIPISNAENARDALQKAGATVELQTYEGGHSWVGDVFGNIRKGITWLEQQVDKKVPK
jgi:predicted esterase